MNSPFKESGFFHTYETQADLEKYLENFNGSDATVAMTVYGIVWNYLASQFDKWLKSQQGEFPITVVWGTDACRQIGERDLDGLRDLGSVGTTVFSTQAEADAYRQGVEDTEGWLEAVVYAGNEDAIPVPTNDHEI